MQANFIESSPLPVKAVLAMMGRIEENYRLPLLPMRRDMRSKLQKIVADVGLIAKPAAPAPRSGGILHLRKLGSRARTRSCCIADRADNATMAKAALQDTTPTTPAGMAPTPRWPKAARPHMI